MDEQIVEKSAVISENEEIRDVHIALYHAHHMTQEDEDTGDASMKQYMDTYRQVRHMFPHSITSLGDTVWIL